jgi:hypothetical protein
MNENEDSALAGCIRYCTCLQSAISVFRLNNELYLSRILMWVVRITASEVN